MYVNVKEAKLMPPGLPLLPREKYDLDWHERIAIAHIAFWVVCLSGCGRGVIKMW